MADESEKVVRLVPPIAGDAYSVEHGQMLDGAKECQFSSLTIVGTLTDGRAYVATSDGAAQMIYDIERAKLFALADAYPTGED